MCELLSRGEKKYMYKNYKCTLNSLNSMKFGIQDEHSLILLFINFCWLSE